MCDVSTHINVLIYDGLINNPDWLIILEFHLLTDYLILCQMLHLGSCRNLWFLQVILPLRPLSSAQGTVPYFDRYTL